MACFAAVLENRQEQETPAPPSNGSLRRAGSRVRSGREQGAFLPALPVAISDRAWLHRTRVTRTAKLGTSGALARAASMTFASTHPTALAVHSGSVTDTPRPERPGETPLHGISTGALIQCCSGTATTGPNSNDPACPRWREATNSASVWPPSNSWSNAMIASALAFWVVLNQLSTLTRSPRQDRVIEALDQRRQRHRWFDGASSEYGE